MWLVFVSLLVSRLLLSRKYFFSEFATLFLVFADRRAKSYRGTAIKEVQAWWRWKQCKEWMAHFKEQGEPFVFDFKKLLKALSGKEAEAQSEVDAFMEHCAKRWQTREGTCQLKRRRLKPDVRDSPEDLSADVDMADI